MSQLVRVTRLNITIRVRRSERRRNVIRGTRDVIQMLGNCLFHLLVITFLIFGLQISIIAF